MAQKIYNNGSDGKILMSSAGKVIRQPYEFGNAFQNRMSLNNYIKVSGLNYNLYPITELCWFSDRNSTDFDILTTKKAGVNNYLFDITYSVISYTRGTSYNILSISGSGHTQGSTNLYSAHIGDVQGRLYGGYSVVESNVVFSNYLDTIFTDLIIGAKITGTGLTPSIYNTGVIGRYSMFDRYVSDSERKYYYNNKIGAEFQTTNGLVLDLKMDKAEILNTGGSDFVGVRDYSGNNKHGQIMNLPAGTLSEQLAYANANLFVTFLT